MVTCKYTPSWTQWGFVIALGVPHCIPAWLVASKSLVVILKQTRAFGFFFMMLLFHYGNTDKTDADDDVLHTDKIDK